MGKAARGEGNEVVSLSQGAFNSAFGGKSRPVVAQPTMDLVGADIPPIPGEVNSPKKSNLKKGNMKKK
jgi:hypothetical protein